jgi:Biotin/lipoate A/B protein ligase family
MNALADAIAAHCPPEREIVFDWPGTILFNGACIGGGRLGWPQRCAESEIPDWLVFSAMIRAAWVGMSDPGSMPTATSLEEEGFETTDPAVLVEAFARYLMLSFDILSEQGFDAVAKNYVDRLCNRKTGEHRVIDRNGDLLIRRHGQEAERLALVPALTEPAWLDPETGMPKV